MTREGALRMTDFLGARVEDLEFEAADIRKQRVYGVSHRCF